MDNEKPGKDAGLETSTSPTLPKSTPFSANLAQSPAAEPFGKNALESSRMEQADRNGVFANLVTRDDDIAGLVAYSIYKQHKLDWLTAFEKAKSRPPNDEELSSYIIGEGTPRRLATYRHLAEATLSGGGPDVSGSGAGKGVRPAFRRVGASERAALTTGLLATYALIAVLFLIGFLLAAHYTMSSR